MKTIMRCLGIWEGGFATGLVGLLLGIFGSVAQPNGLGAAAQEKPSGGLRVPEDGVLNRPSLSPPTRNVRVWTNSLGMRLVPVPGTKTLFCIWETRVRDWEAFVKATRFDTGDEMDFYDVENKKYDKKSGFNWKTPGFEQGRNHPVVGANWEDAKAFCDWLNKKEAKEKILGPGQKYRLPTDNEWSQAVGLETETGETPQDRDRTIKGVYPWGTQWPPPKGAGNFADETAKKKYGGPVIDGYDDGFAATAPVGSFAVNRYGLFDLSGNVWEWCEDWYDNKLQYRVLRGGSWGNCAPASLLSANRSGATPELRLNDTGFRVVLILGEAVSQAMTDKSPIGNSRQLPGL